MATAARHLSRSILQVGRQVPTKRKCQRRWPCPLSASRNLSTSSPWLAKRISDDEDRHSKDEDTPRKKAPHRPITKNDLGPEDRANFEVLSPQEQDEEMRAINTIPDEMELPEIEAAMDADLDEIAREVDKEEPLSFPEYKAKGRDVGFWADDEDDEFGQLPDEDDEFHHDDITSVAHNDLELHREIREYQRIAAWDMPLLKKFAIPFEPPGLYEPLRFRYTTYMGESHPAAKKVVLQFCTRDLPSLTEPERIKLIKLAGVRYNPDTDVVKMSCEKFEEPAQNKRYLGDLVGKLIKEAKDTTDTFADVPFDFRHHKPKRRPEYPEDWKLRPEQIQKLLSQRQEAQMLEQGRKLIDGKEIVEQYVRTVPLIQSSSSLPFMGSGPSSAAASSSGQRPQRSGFSPTRSVRAAGGPR